MRRLAWIAVLGVLRSASAWSQPAPDKSGYTLFDPTPDDQLRDFAPDRPDKNTGPTTVDAGHVQIEMDVFGWARDGYTLDDSSQRLFFAADPNIKLGLTNRAELDVGIGGYQSLRVTQHGGGAGTAVSGYGDTVVRLKTNLYNNDGPGLSIGVIPFVKFATAAQGLGNHQVEGGVTVPAQFPLTSRLTCLVDAELDVSANVSGRGNHLGTTNLVSLNYQLTEKSGVSAEFWRQDAAAHTPSQMTYDTAVTYLLTKATQLDAGAYIGLNKAAPDFVLYLGVARRF